MPLLPALGRWIRRRGERPNAPGAARELGWGGAPIFSGVVVDEYNPDLRGRQALRTAEKMRRSDAQVRAVEQAVSLPIRATAWRVQEPEGAGAAEREAAALLRENLFGGMEESWDDLLREACLAIYFGFRVPELVWEERGGLLWLARVASRSSELLERWLYDDEGRLVGYLYAGSRPVGEGLRDSAGGGSRYERVAVPLEKTLHFVYDRQHDSPQGFGLWRSMYPHWYFKQALYRIVGIGIERNLLGVPVAVRSDTAQTDDTEHMLEVLRRLRAAEDGAMVVPAGWDLQWFESRRTLVDAMPFLQHHDAKIAQAALAQFLNLGQQAVGTQSLAETHACLFMDALDAAARWIEQTLNGQLLRRWCRLNYGGCPLGGLRPPRLVHRRIAARDPGAWSEALSQLAAGGLLHAGPEDEEHVRDLLELPAVPREQLARREHGSRERREQDA